MYCCHRRAIQYIVNFLILLCILISGRYACGISGQRRQNKLTWMLFTLTGEGTICISASGNKMSCCCCPKSLWAKLTKRVFIFEGDAIIGLIWERTFCRVLLVGEGTFQLGPLLPLTAVITAHFLALCWDFKLYKTKGSNCFLSPDLSCQLNAERLGELAVIARRRNSMNQNLWRYRM